MTPLPNDILDQILQCTSAFKTLYAAVRVSKTWHRVFQTHPKSIVRSVAENVVGPALPDAVRVLRYSMDNSRKCGREEIDAFTKEDCLRLSENAGVVKRLEVAFSLKYRDPLLPTSQLTWIESWRFSRAIYRIMLYCQVFKMPDDEDQVRDLEDNQHDEIIARRVEMLDQYPTPELLELNAVSLFLRALAMESGGDYLEDEDSVPEPIGDILISTGPAVVLEAHEEGSGDRIVETVGYTVWISGPYTLLLDFFAGPLHRIWTARNVSPPSGEAKSLLGDGPHQSDPCDRCSLTSPCKLRREADWANLHLNIRELFLGKLCDNFTEMDLFEETKPWRNKHKLISELYALKTEEFKDWSPSDALCDACLLTFLSAHLHLWLLRLKVIDGDVPDDCSDGYWCEVQTHVTLHALEHNHLCAPKERS
ncbi:hypothetical protein C8R46DRAFT_1094327 [Mycena filopes]|nr:hypothetical protein C8R46DRAFT_1094327 [Mycena filopes]